MEKPMRIGLVIYGGIDQISGGYLYDRMLVHRLVSLGERVDIISLPSRGYCADALFSPVPSIRNRYPAGEMPDVVIIDELCHPSFSIRHKRLKALLGCPVVALVHHLRRSEDVGFFGRIAASILERRFLAYTDGIIVNSSPTMEEVKKLLPNNRTLPAIIATPAGNRFPARHYPFRSPASGEPIKILFVGNLIQRKGLSTLVRALSLATKTVGAGAFTLTVAGRTDADPAYTRWIRRLVRSLSPQPEVAFAGLVEDEALVSLYEQSHMVCVPSQFEGFGIVYLEGMHFGLPAIGSTEGGASDIIKNGINGYTTPPENTAALADILVRLRKDGALYESLSRGAVETARAFPTWEKSMSAIHTFLRKHFFRP